MLKVKYLVFIIINILLLLLLLLLVPSPKRRLCDQVGSSVFDLSDIQSVQDHFFTSLGIAESGILADLLAFLIVKGQFSQHIAKRLTPTW